MNFYGYLQIIISCTVVYLFLIIAIRLFGKKELAQLSVVDLVFILLISNAVQNAMVGPDNSLAGGLVAAATLFAVNFLFKYLLYRFPKFGMFIQGEPILLVYKGRINRQNLRRARISDDELKEAIREHGVLLVEDVDLAVLEIDGNISILSDGYQKKTTKRHKSHKIVAKTE
ncbi:MAG: DUF421 domain-containing protein [Ruminiclostridium sp.]|nr:DUF421 domain-containing protein [Ruminiclostridium sp.]